jgi:hypothetical protein
VKPGARAAVAFLLLAAVLLSPTLLLLLKAEIDFLCMGFSGAKTVMLLAFLSLVFAAHAVPSPWRPRWNVSVLLGVALLQGVALQERALFTAKAGVPLDSWQSVVLNGRYTTSSLSHMHEPKACLAWLTGYRGQGFDSGFVFLPWLPSPMLMAHALLLLLVAGLATVAVHHFSRSHGTGPTVCLALAVFAMVKNTVDGGFLSQEAVVPIPFVLGLWYGRRGAYLGIALSALYLPLTLWYLSPGQMAFNLIKVLGAYLLLLLPLGLSSAQTSGRRLAGIAGSLLLLSLPWLQAAAVRYARQPPFAIGTLVYAYTPLLPGRELSVMAWGPLPNLEGAPVQVTSLWKGQGMLAYRARVTRATTPMELCRRFGLNVSWQPVVWYRKLAYFTFQGRFLEPLPAGWPSSEMVVEYGVEERPGDSTRIVLGMRGGGRLNSAYDALPPGPLVITDYNIATTRPAGVVWRPGPGAAPR